MTKVANPLGGNIYIDVPVGSQNGIVNVSFKNSIRAPYFSDRTFDQTSRTEWENTERHYPGALADIESKNVMWTVPSTWVTDLSYDDLMEIIDAHNATMEAVNQYVGKSVRGRAEIYMVPDVQIRANAFSTGYPLSNYSTFSSAQRASPLTVGHAFDKVMLHEHGHAEYVSMFNNENEAINHMLATAVGNKVYGQTLQEAFSESLTYRNRSDVTTIDAMNSWVLMDTFQNGGNMLYPEAGYKHRGHADYVELVDMFGWHTVENFNLKINQELNGRTWDQWEFFRTNHNANDRMLRFSREAGVDVSPLFHLWGVNPSNAGDLATAMAAEGLAPSVSVYDRMVEYRSSVPQTQAEYDDFYSRIKDHVFQNDFFGDLADNYDTARGQAAIDRIDELINLYFPNGRPKAISIHADANFGGAGWEFIEGTYNVTDLLNTPVGNDKISSIQIPAGMSVTVYQHGNRTGNSATYTTSMPSLGNLNNQISSMVVSQASMGEAGQVTTDHNWTTVNLSGSYNDPVVIVGPPSRVGGSQISLKVSNVTSNSFQIRVDEWDYLDGSHSVESISYMVLEAGQYTLTDGTVLVAGNQSGQDHDWSTYSLGTAFSGQSAPIVLTNTVTDIGSAAVTTRTIVNSNFSFQVRLQEEEAADGTHSPETISYVAIDQGTGTTGTSAFNAGTVSATSADKNFSFNSAAGFGTTPAFFAGMQTFNGADSATLRYKSVNAAGATIFVEEEQSLDSEVVHTSEDIGFFAIKFGPISGTRVGSPLQAAGQPAAGVDAELISGDDIAGLTVAAENYWADQGADTSLFDSVNYVVTNLDGNLLGLQSGNTIFIDDDAAGFGWYVDGNAATNELFGGMDLFTTLSHELGHVLGFEDIYDDSESDNLMYGYLNAGERRIEPAVVNSAVDSMFADYDEDELWRALF